MPDAHTTPSHLYRVQSIAERGVAPGSQGWIEMCMNSQATIPDASAPPRPCTRLGDRSRRVLLAEDDEDLRRLIAAVLRRVGYGVAEARDGIEVVDRIASTIRGARPHPFGAIVSDMNMPGLTGLDLRAAFRCSRLDTPVILITAFGDVQSRTKASELGAFAYLEKPLNVAQLRGAVERAISAAAPGGAMRPDRPSRRPPHPTSSPSK